MSQNESKPFINIRLLKTCQLLCFTAKGTRNYPDNVPLLWFYAIDTGQVIFCLMSKDKNIFIQTLAQPKNKCFLLQNHLKLVTHESVFKYFLILKLDPKDFFPPQLITHLKPQTSQLWQEQDVRLDHKLPIYCATQKVTKHECMNH